MKAVSHYLLIAGGLSLVTVVATLTLADLAEGQGNRPSTPVVVLNTPGQPVPIVAQGPATVEGTVAASQSGPWTVGVDNLPAVQNVNVLNDTLRVVGSTRTLVRGGGWFRLERSGEAAIFEVPSGVVLTDLAVSVSPARNVPGPVCTDARVTVSENGWFGPVHSFFVPRGSHDRMHLQSGWQTSSPGFAMQLAVLVYEDVHCDGWLMWSGYQP